MKEKRAVDAMARQLLVKKATIEPPRAAYVFAFDVLLPTGLMLLVFAGGRVCDFPRRHFGGN